MANAPQHGSTVTLSLAALPKARLSSGLRTNCSNIDGATGKLRDTMRSRRISRGTRLQLLPDQDRRPYEVAARFRPCRSQGVLATLLPARHGARSCGFLVDHAARSRCERRGVLTSGLNLGRRCGGGRRFLAPAFMLLHLHLTHYRVHGSICGQFNSGSRESCQNLKSNPFLHQWEL